MGPFSKKAPAPPPPPQAPQFGTFDAVLPSFLALATVLILRRISFVLETSDKKKHFDVKATKDSNPRHLLAARKLVDVAAVKAKTFEAPPDFGAAPHYHVVSRFSNLDGGYVLKGVDEAGYGQYEDEEDGKWLFYLGDYGKWFVADECGSNVAFKTSEGFTEATDPGAAPWGGDLAVRRVDLDEGGLAAAATAAGVGGGGLDDERFVDPDFGPNDEAVGEALAADCVWVRAVALSGKPDQAPPLFDKVEPTDVCQGSLGDCWLLAAIAAVAEFPSFIEEQVFVTKAFNPEGSYTVKLYDCGVRAFVEVTFDSLIPCKPKQWWEKGHRPLFAQPKDDELYILMLEKAFAKFAGGYPKLDGGFPCLAWLALTGCEDQQYWQRRDDGAWHKGVLPIAARVAKGQSRDFQSLSIAPTDEEVSDGDFFMSCLMAWDDLNYLMGASIAGDEMEKERSDGLVERHAYSLIAVSEVSLEDGSDPSVRLVQLRNPWGNDREWNGDWSDKSELWSLHPEVAKACGFTGGADDGLFWMPYGAFLDSFTTIQVSAKTMPTSRACFQAGGGGDGDDEEAEASSNEEEEEEEDEEAEEEKEEGVETPTRKQIRRWLKRLEKARKRGNFQVVRRLKMMLRSAGVNA